MKALEWLAKLLWRIWDDITRAFVVLVMATIRGLLFGGLFAILYVPLGVFCGIIAFVTGLKSYDKYHEILNPPEWDD